MDRRLRAALAASLLVNVFAAGAIGGGLVMLSHQEIRHAQRGPALRPLRDTGDQLSPPDRAAFRQTMIRTFNANRDLVRLAREGRRAAADLFVQPQFDQVAVTAALDRARQADSELRRRLELAAVQFAATLPIDERRSLARGLERGGPLRHPPARLRAGQAAP